MSNSTSKTRLVYKVVKRKVRSRYSANGYPSDERKDAGVCLKYIVGKLTVPVIKGSKLFAFNTLEEAKQYACTGMEIWIAEATDVTPGRVLQNSYYTKEIVKRVFADLAYYFREYGRGDTYQDAVLCGSITLLKKVDYEAD